MCVTFFFVYSTGMEVRSHSLLHTSFSCSELDLQPFVVSLRHSLSLSFLSCTGSVSTLTVDIPYAYLSPSEYLLFIIPHIFIAYHPATQPYLSIIFCNCVIRRHGDVISDGKAQRRDSE